jgi:enoyl-CoA hydratase/carnithine racemase
MIETRSYRHITFREDDGIAVITLSRPEKRNALSLATMKELLDVLGEIGRDRAIRVVVLRAEGPAFSAGHDIREMLCRDAAAYREIFDTCVQMMTALQTIPQPVIAEVTGIATAAGCQLVATCDLAFASTEARFATPGVKIGLFCTTPMVALTRAIGRKRAMEMLLTGEFVDAPTAAEWGLINRVVGVEHLHAEVMATARQIAASSSFTISLGKQAFYAQIDLDQPQAYAYAKEVMSLNALEADAQEGMTAFTERRRPTWKS